MKTHGAYSRCRKEEKKRNKEETREKKKQGSEKERGSERAEYMSQSYNEKKRNTKCAQRSLRLRPIWRTGTRERERERERENERERARKRTESKHTRTRSETGTDTRYHITSSYLVAFWNGSVHWVMPIQS
jgi:septal ring factor EnvC (AmiA/AmiB activator)